MSYSIIGIENIDDEVKKEKQHLRALNTEKELARRDDLTGVKNKTAYNEMETSVQESARQRRTCPCFGHGRIRPWDRQDQEY